MLKPDLLWSPNHPDQFVYSATELHLFKIQSADLSSSHGLIQGQKVSDTTFCYEIQRNNVNMIRCIDWYPKQSPEYLIAVGQTSGRIVLTTFDEQPVRDREGYFGKEFVPKHARHCNVVAWHPDNDLLASGYDRYKSEPCVSIWDVNARAEIASTPERIRGTIQGPPIINKSLLDISAGDNCVSLAWLPQEPSSLVVGTNNWLRIYDIRRDPNENALKLGTKNVYGISVDVLCENRLASFCENKFSIWDKRKFEKPISNHSLSTNNFILKLAWCPNRANLLGVLPRDNSAIKLFDISQVKSVGANEHEIYLQERFVRPPETCQIASFVWNPSVVNRLMCVSPGLKFYDLTATERIAASVSSDVTWICGRNLATPRDLSPALDGDISVQMRERARAGYGCAKNPLENIPYVKSDRHLVALWSWFGHLHRLQEAQSGGGGNLGIQSLLRTEDHVSQATLVEWADVQRYHSAERTAALRMCDWDFEDNGPGLENRLALLESSGEYERAAAIALFHLKMARAIESLKRGAVSNGPRDPDTALNSVAMALAGFSLKNVLWVQQCSSLASSLRHPYLRAMFNFLTAKTKESYKDLLDDSEIAVHDRVGFACVYLNDASLAAYVDHLADSLVRAGNLEGIVLTGISGAGLQLLQQYIDNTSDVQTTCLAILHGFTADVGADERVRVWIDWYKHLLNQWQLWEQRALFDIRCSEADKMFKPSEQVCVTCNYCSKPVSRTGSASRKFPGYGGTNSNRITSCPQCRKPLPRCALCLVNMGTPAVQTATSLHSSYTGLGLPVEVHGSKFQDWITWCQSCRHGGHAHHIAAWFKEHIECPVTECHCHCMLMDHITAMSSITSQEQTDQTR